MTDWHPRSALGQALRDLTTNDRRLAAASDAAYREDSFWCGTRDAFRAGFRRALETLAPLVESFDQACAERDKYCEGVMMSCSPCAVVFNRKTLDSIEYGSALTLDDVRELMAKSAGIDASRLDWVRSKSSGEFELWVRMPDRGVTVPRRMTEGSAGE